MNKKEYYLEKEQKSFFEVFTLIDTNNSADSFDGK